MRPIFKALLQRSLKISLLLFADLLKAAFSIVQITCSLFSLKCNESKLLLFTEMVKFLEACRLMKNIHLEMVDFFGAK